MNQTEPVILLVEDSADDALFIRSTFRKARIANRIETVPNAETAMAYLNGDGIYGDRTRFPIPIFLLLDLGLPGIQGQSLLDWVRSKSDFRPLPIIIVTGTDNPQLRRECQKLGANAYFRKELKFEDIPPLVKAVGGSWAFQTGSLEFK